MSKRESILGPILSKIRQRSDRRWVVLFFLLASVSGYWFWTPTYYFCIPIRFDDSWNDPLVQIEIGKKLYEVKLDLGVELSTLYPNDLNEIDKRPCGKRLSIGMQGNKYERAMFEIFGVKIAEFYMPKMKVLEEIPSFAVDSIVTGDPKKLPHYGRIGRKVFEGKNFLLDFASSKMIVCKSFKELAKDGYDVKDFIEAPYKMTRAGICIRAETDAGEQIFLLDTGASHCFLRSPPSSSNWRSQKLILGGFEFGPRDFILYEISPIIDEIDGILGMDFLKEHAIYVDTKKSMTYIAKKKWQFQ